MEDLDRDQGIRVWSVRAAVDGVAREWYGHGGKGVLYYVLQVCVSASLSMYIPACPNSDPGIQSSKQATTPS